LERVGEHRTGRVAGERGAERRVGDGPGAPGPRRCAALLAAALLGAACGPSGRDRALVAAIDAQLEPHVRRGELSGAVVAGRGEEILYARGFLVADVDERTPFAPETPADVGALTETFTASAVWLLAEEGRLELDSPVQRYLPRFPWPEPTVRQLLSHTAGLPERDALAPWRKPEEPWTGALHVELLRRGGFEPLHPPGTAFSPSSVGYDLAAQIVEAVEERSLAGFLQDRLLRRLGIESAYFRPAQLADWGRPHSLGYRREGAWLKPDPEPDGAGLQGGSGLYVSALDLYRWCASFYADPGLKQETLERGSERAPIGSALSALDQLAWNTAPGGRRYRAADHLGHTAFAYRDEGRRHAVVFVSNTAMPVGLRPRLARALVRILEGGPAEPIAVPDRAPLGPDALAATTGAWALPVLGRLELTLDGETLGARLAEGPRYPVRPVGEGRLHVEGLDAWLAFSAPGAAGFSRLHWTSVFGVAEGTRIETSEEEP